MTSILTFQELTNDELMLVDGGVNWEAVGVVAAITVGVVAIASLPVVAGGTAVAAAAVGAEAIGYGAEIAAFAFSLGCNAGRIIDNRR